VYCSNLPQGFSTCRVGGLCSIMSLLCCVFGRSVEPVPLRKP
jgi:hypothetical protein